MMTTEIMELKPEEIEAVSGGMLAHLAVVAVVGGLAIALAVVMTPKESKDYGSGTCNTDGSYST